MSDESNASVYNISVDKDDNSWERIKKYQMSIDDIIKSVKDKCQKAGVNELYLFGSYAAGNPTKTSDIDFVVKGCPDIIRLKESVDDILTLKTIDLFDYDTIKNENLKKDIDLYAKKIY